MKKKFFKIFISVILPVIMLFTAGFYCAFSSFGASKASAVSGNGGIVFVGNNAIYNHTSGTMSGGTATNGGAVYVASGGTFNMSGGSIFGNKATNNGDSIYNNGTFIMTGGTLGETDGVAWVYCDRNAVTQIYGGTVHDNFYMCSNLQTKMACNIQGTITLQNGATITVQDYAGTTPTYKIKLENSRPSGTIVTLKGSSTEPDLSKLNITGYDTDSYKLKTEKDSSGNWTVVLYSYALMLPSNWKTQVASTTYMTTTVTLANLTSIKFVSSVPSGYTKIGTLSTGLPVYRGTTATEIAFVCEKIYAPEDSSKLFSSSSKLTTIDTSVFDTSKVKDMSSMFAFCSGLSNLDVSNFNTSNVTNMYQMFYYCSGLTSLDLSSFNTSNVTNMSGMFYRCTGLSSLDLRNFNTSNVTNMSEMFSMWLSSANKLTNIDVSKFDTSNVTNMSSMFSNCKGLTSLNLSNFDTAKVTVMSRMFEDCSSLTSLNLSNFNTSNVTNMSSMFYNCSSLTSLNLSNFITSNVTNMSNMFSNCKGLTSLNLSNFNTSNVTNMSNMFFNCKGLTSLDLSNFNTLNVTNMSSMFTICSGLKSINLTGLNTLKVTTMKLMFSNCSSLTSIDVSNFNTSNVTNMSSMFDYCSRLTSIDVSNFNTSNVTDMSSMFYQCSSSTSIDVSNFNTSNVTDMKGMFFGCSSLTSLNLSNFNTSNVTNMSSMFLSCPGLTSLDVSNFDTAKVTDMSSMFYVCSGLTSLDLSNFNTSNVTDMSEMFYSCKNLASLDLSSFNMSKVTNDTDMFKFNNITTNNNIKLLKTPYNNTAELPITTGSTLYNQETGEVVTSVPANTTKSLTYVNENPIKIFPTTWKTELGSIFNSIYQDDSTVTLIRFEKTVPTGYTLFGTLSTGIKVYQKDYKEIAFVAQSTIFAPENSSSLFASVAYTSILFNNFDTSKVTTMNQMFSSCSSLETADISGFNTSKVTDMNAIFSGCHKWTNIDVSNFNTAQVTDMTSMFSGCFAVTSLNVRSFNTSKVTKMAYMFLQCKSLKSLDASNFDTSNVTDMMVMFSGCSSLETLDVSSFNMTKVDSSAGYFSAIFDFGSSNAIKIFKTPYNNSAALAITTGSSLYVVANGTKYTSVPASTSTSLALRSANTISFNYNGGSGSESSRTVLYGLTVGTLPSASQSGYTLNGWYTASSGGSRVYSSTVVTQSQVLYAQWTENTPTPDPDPPTPPDPDPPSGSLSINNVEYLIFTIRSGVPSGLTETTELDYSSRTFFNSGVSPTVYANETGTRVAFVGTAGELIAPDDCSNMFSGLNNLKWVIFRNYDTFNVTTMEGMFQDMPNLEFVDMMSIQTPNVTSMRSMFHGCSGLKQIAFAKFDCINLDDAGYMFYGCTSLGINPLYSGNAGFNESIQAYPELKYTYNLTNAEHMFDGANWTTFCMPYFFTDNLSNVTGMFNDCNIEILDLSQFNCKNFDPTDIVDSGSLAPGAVYTPRYCNVTLFMQIFGGTYSLAGGGDIGIFQNMGNENVSVPFSLCFVDTSCTAIDTDTVYQFDLVYNEWSFPELEALIQEMIDRNYVFSGDRNNLRITTYSPIGDIYYLLPIPYEIEETVGEEPFAGWVPATGKDKEQLNYTDFIEYWYFVQVSSPIEAISWLDEDINGPTFNSSSDVSSGSTPYQQWTEGPRKKLAHVRYLPSCRGNKGQIFRGWSGESESNVVEYYTNIASFGSNTSWWSDGINANFKELNDIITSDYWSLPSESSSSFTANTLSKEQDLERMMNLYETNKQEILIPDDKKVTITELKLKKVS